MKEKVTVEEVHDAFRIIVKDGKHGSPALNYAVGYAQYGLVLSHEPDLKIQCLYVLNNITSWRYNKKFPLTTTSTIKNVRDTLKRFVKEN